MSRRDWTRRRFLRGIGGATLALPFLESLGWRRGAKAVAPERPIYSVFMRQANGVAQGGVFKQEAYNTLYNEPETFWPRETGPITQASLSGLDSDRTMSELADHADRLLVVRGCDHPFPMQMCGHSGAGAMCLTAARFDGAIGNGTLANGISIDTRIAEALLPGVEPMTLMAGKVDGFLGPVLSYRGPGQRRAAETNPYNIYLDLFFGGSDLPQEVLRQQFLKRQSVNDLVREEMQHLLSRDMGSRDRQRLELHFDAIRDIEVMMACMGLTDADVEQMAVVNENPVANDALETVVQLHSRLIALAFACDLRRTATLQVGAGQDGTEYVIDGELRPSFHHISHRKASDDVFADVAVIDNAAWLHHQIDRIHARLFKHLLDRLDEQVTIAGNNLLDDCVALWTNDLGTGPVHGHTRLPHVIGGSGGGFLRQGVFVDVGGAVPNNKFLSTLINAVGIRKDDGEYVDDFGDPDLEPGVIPEMIA